MAISKEKSDKIRSPLRYPGGKQKAIKQIAQYIPENFTEFREPFIGGGSVFIYLKQKFPEIKFWINDLNTELYYFWAIAQKQLPDLVAQVTHVKNVHKNGKELYRSLLITPPTTLSDLDRATRFFVLNRITFSGTVESGGFSQTSFEKRFTWSSIDRLKRLEAILTPDVKITNLDYSELLNNANGDVFVFLDPPYLYSEKSRLYGNKGDLHTNFNHQGLATNLKNCDCQFLITYDDSPKIRQNFDWAKISEYQLQYGMNNYKQKSAAIGQELFISNWCN